MTIETSNLIPVEPPAREEVLVSLPVRVCHIISSLEVGGAEVLLWRLLEGTDTTKWLPSVIALGEGGQIATSLRELGIPVIVLNRGKRLSDVSSIPELFSALRVLQPDIIQTWMYHSNVLGGLAARARRVPVIWGIHIERPDRVVASRTTVLVAYAAAALSRLPTKIVCCSDSARTAHQSMGYAGHRLIVIPNGFDTSTFQPSDQARRQVRSELGVAGSTLLVGCVARVHPQKDHETLLRAAAILLRGRTDTHFVLAGAGADRHNIALSKLIADLDIGGRVHLLGARQDVPRLMAAFDIATLSSVSEGLPMTIGEAMASGVPCVTTDVGDCRRLIGETGFVVPPRDAQSLADGWRRLFDAPEERAALGKSARIRVQDCFSLDVTRSQYEVVYLKALADRASTAKAVTSWTASLLRRPRHRPPVV